MSSSLQNIGSRPAATREGRTFESGPIESTETSVFDFATVLLRNIRWLILGMVGGGLLALLPLAWKEQEYRATASFTPQNMDAPRPGLSALAGQFGIAIPTANMNQSPQFYQELLRSRVILSPFANDTLVVAERGGERVPFSELFGITATSPESRADAATAVLGG